MKKSKSIHCQQCRHYYVTWDAKAPHGCRKLGFKSTSLPNHVVFSSSGAQCLYHDPKSAEKQISRKKQPSG